jgi:ATP-binding cassette subfamily B protein
MAQTAVQEIPQKQEEKANLWPVYRWTLSFLKPYRGLLASLIATASVASVAELAVPKLLQIFIDVVLPNRDYSLFLLLMLGFVVLIGLVLAAGVMQNIIQRKLQEQAARDVQYTMFLHLRKLGFAYYEQHPVGETLSFLNTEVTAMQNFYRNSFPWLIQGLLFSIISISLMVWTSPQLSFIVLPCFLLYYIFGPTLERKASETGKVMAQSRISENQKVYESISALSELRAYSAEAWDIRRYLEKVKDFNKYMIRTYWYAYWRGTNRRITYNIGGIMIFIYGFHLLQADALTPGAFVSFLLYYFTAMHRLTVVVTNITEQKVLMYQVDRLYQFIQTSPSVRESATAVQLEQVEGHIEFKGVHYSYHDGQKVLDGLSFSVAPGERVALVGTSGNGKSTVLKLVGRFYDPDEGSIELDGVPLHALSFASLRTALGIVFQETYVFGSSVKDNIRFGRPQASDEEVEEAAKAAYAHEFICQLPDGYDTLLGERGVKLSGGQKQRIAIARMLIRQPSVILLDEATSALDNISEVEVQRAFDTLLQGRTVLAVAHRLSSIKDFDRIIVLEQGRIAESGTYSELMDKGGLFYRLSEGHDVSKEAVHG